MKILETMKEFFDESSRISKIVINIFIMLIGSRLRIINDITSYIEKNLSTLNSPFKEVLTFSGYVLVISIYVIIMFIIISQSYMFLKKIIQKFK